MKILVVHHCDSWGGAGVSLCDICKMLMSKHEVTVCLPHLNTEVDRQLKTIDGIKTIAINADMGMISAYNGGPKIISRTFIRNLLRIKKSKVELKKIIAVGEYDLIVHNSITVAWAAVLAKEMNICNVMYIRETKINNCGYYLCRKLINRYCDGILFISDFDKKTFNSKLKHQKVVHDCLDFGQYDIGLSKDDAIQKMGLDDSKFNVLYVGGCDELKGYSVILSAMQKIKDPHINLVIAGSVPENKKVLSNNIKYVGKVFDMPMLYRACDVLVFPSTKGHQARPVFEAGAMGIPVIISDFPETAGEVQNEKNGLLFEPESSDDLICKIFLLQSSPEICKKYGKQNYMASFEKHNYDFVKDALLEFIDLDISE